MTQADTRNAEKLKTLLPQSKVKLLTNAIEAYCENGQLSNLNTELSESNTVKPLAIGTRKLILHRRTVKKSSGVSNRRSKDL